MSSRPFWIKGSFAILMLSSLTLSAACGPLSDTATALPGDVYSLDTDPLPAGAQLVSASDYAVLKAKPGFTEVNQNTLDAQAQTADTQLADDETTIRQAEQKSGLSLMPVEPQTDDKLVARGDGNFDLTVSTARKTSQDKFVTMGTAWSKHSIATALKVVGGYDNQLALYSKIYEGLTPETAKSLGLADPALIVANPGLYPLSSIVAINVKLANNFQLLAQQYGAAPVGAPAPVAPRACGMDTGDGNGNDSWNSKKPGCGIYDFGIYANVPFAGEEHLTCVKDQGNRGSCAAFGTTAAIEYQVHKTHGAYVNLSEQALYNRITAIWDPRVYADGSWPATILPRMENDSWLMPYENQSNYNRSPKRETQLDASRKKVLGYTHSCDGYSETCSDTAPQSGYYCSTGGGYNTCGYLAYEFTSPNGFRITTHAQIWDPTEPQLSTALIGIAVLLQNPVIWGFDLTDVFSDADAFVNVGSFESLRGAHAVSIVGFISNSKLGQFLPAAPPAGGGGYFIVKNSWSPCWGDGGYIYVSWDYVAKHTHEASVLHKVQ